MGLAPLLQTISLAYADDAGVSVCRTNAMALVRAVRLGRTALDHASLVAYDDGVLAFADHDPPRLVR
jgi:hypothetical protein